jgi:hypothetical protein
VEEEGTWKLWLSVNERLEREGGRKDNREEAVEAWLRGLGRYDIQGV